MKIQKISVTGLFGIFDHVIPLHTDERITIIHGPNGFGKTAMLRMLDGFFNAQYEVFWTVPFTTFQIDLDNNDSIEILKSAEFPEKDLQKQYITISSFRELGISQGSLQLNFETVHPRSDENSYLYKLLAIMDKQPEKKVSREEPQWLEELRKNICVRLIESQRLLNVTSDSYSGTLPEKNAMIPMVSAYSEEIAQLIQSKLADYGATSQSLDRTFPIRVLQSPTSVAVTDEQLRHQLSELEETRSGLIEVGLLDRDDSANLQIQSQSIDDSTKNVLSVYVEDTKKKLGVFSDIASRIDLLRRIVNRKFEYSYKEIDFDKEKGFVFNVSGNPSSSHKATLSPTDLSSGEQHELVLLYELLFKVEPNSLVLIDEPELSLHVGWQSQFLKDLQEITKLANLDILMATHSPDIIQDRWDLTVELQRPEK